MKNDETNTHGVLPERGVSSHILLDRKRLYRKCGTTPAYKYHCSEIESTREKCAAPYLLNVHELVANFDR